MKWLQNSFSSDSTLRRRRGKNRLCIQTLEEREVMTADPLPVLMVIADRQDFYYREYNEPKLAIEAKGIDVVVAATTTAPSIPHAGSGQPAWNTSVTPDIALANVNAADYSAIVFVGGWGASMYQYAFNDPNLDGVTDNYYMNGVYNGDSNLNDGQIAPQKVAVNNLINQFLASNKQVAAICHGVTVLAWARVNGASPLAGKQVAVPHLDGAPQQYYNGVLHNSYYPTGQHDQVADNGGFPSSASGVIGPLPSAVDDVVVDGLIITAQDYDAATLFGTTIANQVIASLPADPPPSDTPPSDPPPSDPPPPVNHSPIPTNTNLAIAENTVNGTVVGQVTATDPDAGQTLYYEIVGGNPGGALAIDPNTGVLRVANAATLDYETRTSFSATVRVSDNGSPSLSATSIVSVQLTDVAEVPVNPPTTDLMVQGTSKADTIYVLAGKTAGTVNIRLNNKLSGPYTIPAGGRVIVYGGDGADRIYATDVRVPVRIFGEAGNDQITGGAADDYLDGGSGNDRITAGRGDDTARGGDGNDQLFGREGNDLLLGDAGNDQLDGYTGNDLLIGGLGTDQARGGADEDLLIGGRTSFDSDDAYAAVFSIWKQPISVADRMSLLGNASTPIHLIAGDTVLDDAVADRLMGEAGIDAFFANIGDRIWA